MKILIPRTNFLKILTPFLGCICIDTSIFTRSIIISVKIELSLRLTGYGGDDDYLYLVSGGGNGFDIEVVARLPVHLALVDSYWGGVCLK